MYLRLWFWQAPQNRRFLPCGLYSSVGCTGSVAMGVTAGCCIITSAACANCREHKQYGDELIELKSYVQFTVGGSSLTSLPTKLHSTT